MKRVVQAVALLFGASLFANVANAVPVGVWDATDAELVTLKTLRPGFEFHKSVQP